MERLGVLVGQGSGRVWALFEDSNDVIVMEFSRGVLGQEHATEHARYPRSDWGQAEAWRHGRQLVTQAGGTVDELGAVPRLVVWRTR